MIKVLITEDSSVIRTFLEKTLNSDPELKVVGTARNGIEAVEKASQLKPDVITMDIHMPGMDGFEATRTIMETNPVPIVICSASWDPTEVSKTFRSMEAGAVAALEKPRGFTHTEGEGSIQELIDTIKAMASVKVVRRWSRLRNKEKSKKDFRIDERPVTGEKRIYRITAIGSSTGGPLALQNVLCNLSRDFPVPVVIVQHIAQGFLSGLVDWLGKTTDYTIKIAEQNAKLMPGTAYLAPDALQMGVSKESRIFLEKGESTDRLCPSVAYLFDSVRRSFGGSSIGVLLTGMGKDGARELKEMHDEGALTFAQDEESSIVFGMPGEAVALGAADYVLPCQEIAQRLNAVFAPQQTEKSAQ